MARVLIVEQIAALNRRFSELQSSAEEPAAQKNILQMAFQELSNTLEELRVAEEELRQQNEQLLESSLLLEAERQRYQDLFEFAPSAYIVTDIDGIILDANRAASQLFNLEHKFLLRKPLATFVPKESRSLFRSSLSDFSKSDRSAEHPVRLLPRHGTEIDTAVTVTVMRGPGGKPDALRWLIRDCGTRPHESQENQ